MGSVETRLLLSPEDFSNKQVSKTALKATQGQMDGFFGQLPFKCHLEEVASVGD